MTHRPTIKGYASLFHIKDRDSDIVTPGAFSKSLRAWRLHQQWPKMLWQHQTTEPIGRWTDIHEDQRGLYAIGELNLNTQRGKEAAALLQQGAIDSLSIGFRTLKSQWNPHQKSRELLDIDLLEISLVTFASNPLARVH